MGKDDRSNAVVLSSLTKQQTLKQKMFQKDEILHPSTSFVPLSIEPDAVRRFWAKANFNSKWYPGSDFINDLLLDNTRTLKFELRCDAGFRNFFRMSSMEFERLLNLIGPRIAKKETDIRRALSINERLGLTLRFLTSGETFHSLMYSFKIPKQVISKVIPEVCEALIEVLQDYIRTPKNENDWKKNATSFNRKWKFPNCVGVIDGKHITLQAPVKSGMEFYNCKGFYRVVLFSVIDSDYNFIYADIECQCRISDGGLFRGTKFKKALEENTAYFPSECPLPGKMIITPLVFLADDAFPLTPNVMKPYPGSHIPKSKRKLFNSRFNRGRRVSENVFGVISTVFRVLRLPMSLQPEVAKKVILSIIYLHNFLRKSPSKQIYNPPGTFDQECLHTGELMLGVWRRDEPGGFSTFSTVPRRSTSYAESVRNRFTEYFSSPAGQINCTNNN